MKRLILFLLLLMGITSCDTLYYDSGYYSDFYYYRRPTIIIRPDPPVRPLIKPYRHVRPMERR